MSANDISQKAQQFIAQYIHSIEQLEIFLVLGEVAGRSLSAHEVFKKVLSSEKSSAQCLEDFSKQGLAISESNGKYRFCDSPETAQVASELAKAYRERHVTIIEMIYKHPVGQIQSFADAFRLRKGK